MDLNTKMESFKLSDFAILLMICLQIISLFILSGVSYFLMIFQIILVFISLLVMLSLITDTLLKRYPDRKAETKFKFKVVLNNLCGYISSIISIMWVVIYVTAYNNSIFSLHIIFLVVTSLTLLLINYIKYISSKSLEVKKHTKEAVSSIAYYLLLFTPYIIFTIVDINFILDGTLVPGYLVFIVIFMFVVIVELVLCLMRYKRYYLMVGVHLITLLMAVFTFLVSTNLGNVFQNEILRSIDLVLLKSLVFVTIICYTTVKSIKNRILKPYPINKEIYFLTGLFIVVSIVAMFFLLKHTNIYIPE